MGKRIVYHVVKRNDQWAAVKEGARRASSTADTKAAAVQRAKELAKAQPLGQIKIHKSNGLIQTEHTYGKDPRKYLG